MQHRAAKRTPDLPAQAAAVAPGQGETGKKNTPKEKGFRVVKRVWRGLILLTLVLAAYHGVVHYQTEHWLQAESDRLTAGQSSTRGKVIALRDHVRRRVDFHDVDREDRPYFRANAREILEEGHGYCGEATRAFVSLARHQGIRAQRANLNGREQHVVAVVELEPGQWVVIDPFGSELNRLFDSREWTLDQLIVDQHSPFNDYSNINLRRLPLINQVVQRIKVEESWLTTLMEQPDRMKALLWLAMGLGLLGIWAWHRLLVLFYAWRLELGRHTAPAHVAPAAPPAAPAVIVGRDGSAPRPEASAPS
jgi:hypothetical protein